MPSAAPNSRVASFIAEPAPARLSGTADMIDAVIGDIDNETPVISGVSASHDVPERRVDAEPGEETEPERDEQHAERDRAVRAEAVDDARRERGDDQHDHRDRQQAHRGVERREPEHELEVLRHEEHHAVHGQEDEHHGAAADAERGVAEVVHVEHRLVGVQLPEHERGEHRRRRRRTRRAWRARSTRPRAPG